MVAIARHLARLGWEVTVVAPDPSLVKHPADDFEAVSDEMNALGVAQIFTGHRWRCLTVELQRPYRGIGWFLGGICRRIARAARIEGKAGWYAAAYKACDHLKPNDVDVILASSYPFGTFKLARRLGRRLGCPFVLDYRDLWSGGCPQFPRSFTAREKRVEADLLAESAAVSVISPSMRISLVQQFGVEPDKIHVVPNGYDPADFVDVKPRDFGHFAIVYTGKFYPPQRDVSPLLKALKHLEANGAPTDWKFHYYGPDDAHVRDAADRHGLQDSVVVHGMVHHREALSAVAGAGAAVVITSVFEDSTTGDRGILTGKIYEPIGLGTPVLTVAPPGSDPEGVIETVGRGRVFSGAATKDMAAFLGDLMRGKVPPAKRPEAYSWPSLISGLDAMLRNVICS